MGHLHDVVFTCCEQSVRMMSHHANETLKCTRDGVYTVCNVHRQPTAARARPARRFTRAPRKHDDRVQVGQISNGASQYDSGAFTFTAQRHPVYTSHHKTYVGCFLSAWEDGCARTSISQSTQWMLHGAYHALHHLILLIWCNVLPAASIITLCIGVS